LALAPDVERARQTVIQLSAKFPQTADFTADFTIFTINGFSPRRNGNNLISTVEIYVFKNFHSSPL
jgi:hypothetical protein